MGPRSVMVMRGRQSEDFIVASILEQIVIIIVDIEDGLEPTIN